jgi:hypothetical protein
MASIFITEAADSEVRRLYAELGNGNETVMSSMESSRGPHGEAVWEEVAPAQWAAEVVGWEPAHGKQIEEQALHIGGLDVLLDTHAEAAKGSLIIDAVDGKLTVASRVS